MYIVEKSLREVRLNVDKEDAGACKSCVNLANKVKELFSYMPKHGRPTEEGHVARVRSMLPLDNCRKIGIVYRRLIIARDSPL